MLRIIAICLLCFCFSNAYAYNFTKVDKLFDTIQQDYNGVVNMNSLITASNKALAKFDNSLTLYSSDSKAFLYQNNLLIGEFEIPQKQQISSWKDFLNHIFEIGVTRSQSLSHSTSDFEDEIIVQFTKFLDTYSRTELNTLTQPQVNYQIYDNILYVQSASFYVGFTDYLVQLFEKYNNMQGIILDFRNNHGGDFAEAIKVSDLFLDNALITYRQTKNSPDLYYTSHKGDILNGKPIVVLMNEETASAAEMVTAALYEQSRATLIGTKTYGKDCIQRIHKMDKYNVFITNGHFYTPSGKRINGKGILPQICTGVNDSCYFSDKSDSNKDILTAINLIKKKLG